MRVTLFALSIAALNVIGIDQELQGDGYMYEALERLMRYAFEDLRLHRVMANYQPVNIRSGRLLERLGFEREGYARDYLHVDGGWRDHVMTALVRPAGSKSRPRVPG